MNVKKRQNTDLPDRSPTKWGIIVTLFALLVNVGFVLESHRSVVFQIPVVDAASYWNQAQALAQGQAPAAKPFWQPPLYVYSLAALLRCGLDTPLAVRLVHAAVGAAIALLCFLIARRCAGMRVGLIAAGLVTFYGPLLFFSTQLLPTGPATALNLLALWCWLHVMARPAWAWSLASGLAIGLAALMVSNILIVVPVMIAWLAWKIIRPTDRARWIEVALTLLIGVAVVILPVSLRNYAVSGQKVLISTNGGINLFIGNNAQAADTIAIRPGVAWEQLVARPYRQGARNDAEADAFFLRTVWTYVREHPGAWLAGMARKTLHLLNGREVPRNVDLYVFRPHSALLAITTSRRGSVGLPFGLLAPLALWGLATAWRGGSAPRVLALYVLIYAGSIVLFFPTSRYLMPMLPAMVVLAVCGGLRLLDHETPLRERRIGLAMVLSLLVLLNLPVWLPTDAVNFESDLETNLGVGLQTRGDLHAAMTHYRKAIELNPVNADAYRFMGTTYRVQGRQTAARWHLEQALRLSPDHAHALQDLAIMAFEDGDTQRAVDILMRVLTLTPDNRHAMVNLGIGLMKLGRADEAQNWFMRAGVMGTAGVDLGKLRQFQR